MGERRNLAVTYLSPPLVEVAISIQFDPPHGLSLAHLGAFWFTQREALPTVRTASPIVTLNENFEGGGWLPPSLQLALTNEPDCRLQMTSENDEWMYQVQRNRLVVNWRKRNVEYPRFHATWKRFNEAWTAWTKFLVELKFPSLRPRLWEVTYVNRIPQGELWTTPNDWPRIFPGLWGGVVAPVQGASLTGMHGQWVWHRADPPMRLYVEPKPARSGDQPHQEVLLLSLTARGLVDPSNEGVASSDPGGLERIGTGISLGHELIVSTFDNIASDIAKKVWGRNANAK